MGIKMMPMKGISENTIKMEDIVVAILLKRMFAPHG